MTIYRYRIWYKWCGPSASDFFAEEKTSEDLDRAFDRIPPDLEYKLEDKDAAAQIKRSQSNPEEGVLTVITTSSKEIFEKALVTTLNDWRMFGEIIK